MNAIRMTLIAALAAAVLIVGAAAGTAAAAPGPDDAAGAADANATAGPPSDLPSPVTDFLSGDLDSLGDAVSDIAGDAAPGEGGD